MEIIRGHYCSIFMCVCVYSSAFVRVDECVSASICNPVTLMQVPDCYACVGLGHVETHLHGPTVYMYPYDHCVYRL